MSLEVGAEYMVTRADCTSIAGCSRPRWPQRLAYDDETPARARAPDRLRSVPRFGSREAAMSMSPPAIGGARSGHGRRQLRRAQLPHHRGDRRGRLPHLDHLELLRSPSTPAASRSRTTLYRYCEMDPRRRAPCDSQPATFSVTFTPSFAGPQSCAIQANFEFRAPLVSTVSGTGIAPPLAQQVIAPTDGTLGLRRGRCRGRDQQLGPLGDPAQRRRRADRRLRRDPDRSRNRRGVLGGPGRRQPAAGRLRLRLEPSLHATGRWCAGRDPHAHHHRADLAGCDRPDLHRHPRVGPDGHAEPAGVP